MRKKLLLLLFFSVWALQIHPARNAGLAAPAFQTLSPAEQAQDLLERMTPEERIGQLFLIGFDGVDVGPESDVYDLIVHHHVGGVVLEAKNDNFQDIQNSLGATHTLIQSLQQAEWLGAQTELFNPTTSETFLPVYIPLFVGISQNGDGYPYDQLYNGLTVLPSPMAIGATWRPDLARQVGMVAGQELSALGFNLFFGPSFDVLETPRPESLGDLGVRTFGGDPYWVGQLGSAYVEGIHLGSGGKMAVIGKNFPGYGGSDRPPQEEVATVRKSLEQLKQIELAAFFSVTGKAETPEKTVDGLLLSHIRYQGLQGNIRFTTRPISFDEQAFATIMGLPEFASWRENGGIVITENLNSRAVRRFYDPTNINFDAWQVTRDAFQAGSDLLYVGRIMSSNHETSRASILSALDFFAQKYKTDLDFALRVNKSALRVLTLKFELYSTFTPENIPPDETVLATIGGNNEVSFEVARQGSTLISPALEDVLPDAPELSDRIIFVSDVSGFQQCSTCPEQFTLSVDAFQQTVLRLYGLEAGPQVVRQNLFSFTFDDMQAMLDNPESFNELEVRLRSAQWLVVSMLDVRFDRPSSLAFRRFLSDRDDLLRGKRIIVFAFNAPYYLDSTDISKLTAYYGIYSKSPQFIDTAARILFNDFTPTIGDLPISVQAINYELIQQTSPDPGQIIPVFLDIVTNGNNATPEPGEDIPPNIDPTPITGYQIGEVIPLRTGVILDHNGNPVPDGTPVQFRYERAGEISFSSLVETNKGVARTAYLVNGGGTLQISALSGDPPARSSTILIEIPGPEATVVPTETPTPEPTLTPTLEPTLTPTPEPTPIVEVPVRKQTDFVDWGLGFLVSLVVSLLAYRVGMITRQVRWHIRWALSALIGGLLSYLYLAINLPGSEQLLIEGRRFGIIWVILLGGLAGWAFGWLWYLFLRKEKPRPIASPENSIPAKTRSG